MAASEPLSHPQQIALLGRAVAAIREAKARVDERVRNKRAFLEAMLDLDLAEQRSLGESLAGMEAELRQAALAAFAATGSKKPGPGVGIRLTTKLEYSEVDAMAFGYQHKLFMRVDSKAFEAFAKKSPEAVPFVTVREDPQATITTDLNKELEAFDDPVSNHEAAPRHQHGGLSTVPEPD